MGYRDTLNRIVKSDFSKATAEEKDEAAKNVIQISSLACAGLVLQPIPGLEQAVLPIQAGMVVALAHVYGEEMGNKRATAVVLDLAAITGVSIVSRQVLTTVAKIFLPVVGGVITAPYTFSVTWGTGYAAIHYFRTGGKPDRAKIKEIFERERKRSSAFYDESKAKENRPAESEVASEKPE
jgi:uncharacterized protein (DUF697 family)